MLDASQAADAPARAQLPPIPAARPIPAGPAALIAAARTLLPVLEAGRPLDAATIRTAMTRAFGASDADGAWIWKDAYEAAEAAVVLFVQRYGRAMRKQAGAGPDGPRRMLAMLAAVAALEPSHTKRSEDQVRLQQFSTPLTLAYAALRAAAVRPGDVVLEPSAGTGMLAVMAECALGSQAADALNLNEIANARAELLGQLFRGASITRHNAENIADHLPGIRPTVVLMNPPFSATPGVSGIRHDADLRHLRSAFAMLPYGGRLAAITSANCVPGDTAWRDAFASLDGGARVVFTMAIDGRAYARRGTGFDTRLTVLDRSEAPGIESLPRTRSGVDSQARAENAAALLDAVLAAVPARLPIQAEPVRTATGPGRDLFGNAIPKPATKRTATGTTAASPKQAHDWGPVAELVIDTGDAESDADARIAVSTVGPYEAWRPGVVRVPGAVEHPTPLVQSAAMAAVPHPAPAVELPAPVPEQREEQRDHDRGRLRAEDGARDDLVLQPVAHRPRAGRAGELADAEHGGAAVGHAHLLHRVLAVADADLHLGHGDDPGGIPLVAGGVAPDVPTGHRDDGEGGEEDRGAQELAPHAQPVEHGLATAQRAAADRSHARGLLGRGLIAQSRFFDRRPPCGARRSRPAGAGAKGTGARGARPAAPPQSTTRTPAHIGRS